MEEKKIGQTSTAKIAMQSGTTISRELAGSPTLGLRDHLKNLELCASKSAKTSKTFQNRNSLGQVGYMSLYLSG